MTPEFIVIHHSLTADSGTVSWGAIRRFHQGLLPGSPHRMVEIGYHAGVELVGQDYELLLGRFWDQEGAHAAEAGMNGRSLGICLIGNFDELPPRDAQWGRAIWLVRWLQRLFGIPAGNVIGHREVGLMVGKDWAKGEYKTCPGRLFPMAEFRGALAAAVMVLALVLPAAGVAQSGPEPWDSPENRCAQGELIRLERDGGIPMDPRTGHGAAVDAILRTCAGEPGRVAAEGLGGGEPQGRP